MKFSDLPTGARFRFFSRGLLHTKLSGTSYAPVTGGAVGVAKPDAEVQVEEIPVDPAAAPATPPAKSAEKRAREMLERIGIPNVKKIISAALAELVALIEQKAPPR